MEKSACVNFLFLIWTIFGCLVVESSAGGRGAQYNSRNTVTPEPEEDKPIKCYKCNSANDPNCGDPFEPYSIGVVDCSLLPRPEHLDPNITATICRKTVQKVYGKVRVVRDCGYIRDERDNKECMKRSGTHDVQVWYCSCTSSLCNGGPNINVNHAALALPLLVTAVLAAFTSQHS